MEAKAKPGRTITETRPVRKLFVCPKCRTGTKHKFCLEKEGKKLLDSSLPKATIDEILRHDEYLDASNVGDVARSHYLIVWRQMYDALGSYNLKELKLRDIIDFRNWCEERFAYYTTFMKIAKIMAYMRTKNDGELPKEFKKFKMDRPVSERVNERNVLRAEEVVTLSKSTNCPRDEAFIYCLWESARRCDEFLRMRARDLRFVTTPKGEYAYYKVYVDKSRGEKREAQSNFIVSYPALLNWLKDHPSIDWKLMMRNDPEAEKLKYEKTEDHDPDAPIWCIYRYGKKRGSPIDRDHAWFIVNRAKERAGIKKPASPHRLRHSRITWMKLNNYSDEEVRIACGYSRFSKMPTYYSHVGQADFNNKQLQMHGLAPPSKEKEKLTIKHCERCKAPNEPNADYCMRCGEPLTRKALGEVDEIASKPNQLLAEMLKDKEFKELMVKKMAELNKNGFNLGL